MIPNSNYLAADDPETGTRRSDHGDATGTMTAPIDHGLRMRMNSK
jgi:hypothetical protein